MQKVWATSVLVVVVSVFVALGRWQWDSAHSNPAGEPLVGTFAFTDVVEAEEYVPLNAIGAKVTATGTLRTDLVVLVPFRNATGISPNAQECWQIVPLQLNTGLAIAVVTSATSCSVSEPPQPPQTATVEGILQPPDVIPEGSTMQPFLAAVSTDLLITRWPFQIYDGYIVTDGIDPLMPNPPGARLDLQNAAYAIQWWLFCGFAIFVWWRYVRPDEDPAESSHEQGTADGHRA